MTGIDQANGVYIMRVASMLTDMHPQTLRKYEREGLLEPSRNKKHRMYSDEDIIRLKTIKHLVDNVGLNIAGVKIVLKIQDALKEVKEHLISEDPNEQSKEKLLKRLDESLNFVKRMPNDYESDSKMNLKK